MPKITIARDLLYKKWTHIITNINICSDSQKALIIYLNKEKNIYNEKILFYLTRKLEKQIEYEKHHIFPKSVGGPNKEWNFVDVTQIEHQQLHHLRFQVYGEYIDKLANIFLIQPIEQRKKYQCLGSRTAVILRKCGFQNDKVQKEAAQKGRKSMTKKKKKGYFNRLNKTIQLHFKKDQIWVYKKQNQIMISINIKAFSCLSLVDLLEQLESSYFLVGTKESKKTTKTNGLSKVIKKTRAHYCGWFFL